MGDTDSDDDGSDDDDSDTDSDDDDSDSSDTDGSGSSTATTASSVSYCASLSQNQCANAYADNGQAICAMNAVSDSCYAVVAQKGMYGSGNYDDGYSAAAQEMEQESQLTRTVDGDDKEVDEPMVTGHH